MKTKKKITSCFELGMLRSLYGSPDYGFDSENFGAELGTFTKTKRAATNVWKGKATPKSGKIGND